MRTLLHPPCTGHREHRVELSVLVQLLYRPLEQLSNPYTHVRVFRSASGKKKSLIGKIAHTSLCALARIGNRLCAKTIIYIGYYRARAAKRQLSVKISPTITSIRPSSRTEKQLVKKFPPKSIREARPPISRTVQATVPRRHIGTN